MRLIDADALKEYIDLQKWRKFDGCTIGEAFKIMTDEQPTIEERKMGKWERKLYQTPWPICSECGIYGANESNYCPNCGADMRGEENEPS